MHEFLTGSVPTDATVAGSLGISRAEAGEAFERLAAGRAFVLQSGTRDIRMAAPFAARPSGFTVRLLNRQVTVEANCVWDALGVSGMLHEDVDIATTCPCCNEALSLQVRGDAVEGAGVAHFAVPAAHWWDDIGFT